MYQKADAIRGCNGAGRVSSAGFHVDYYHYPMKYVGGTDCYDVDPTYGSTDYQQGGYKTYGGGYIGSSDGVTNVTFGMTIQTARCYSIINGNLPAAFNYPETIALSNFTMVLSGYFYARMTGDYQFLLNNVDEAAYGSIGAGNAFDCCQKSDTISNPTTFDFGVTSSSVTVSMQAGVFYPLRVLYLNARGNLAMQFQFVDPNGLQHPTFNGYIFNFPDDSSGNGCPIIDATTTEPWTQTFTSTYTTETACEVADGSSTTEVLVVVKTPVVQTATTTYTPWTGATTNSIGTGTVTETGSDGIPTVKTIYTVETPEVQTATTVYTGWTGEYTSTFATDLTTVTGSDGIPTITTIYSVKTPAEPESTYSSGFDSSTTSKVTISDNTSIEPTYSLSTVSTSHNDSQSQSVTVTTDDSESGSATATGTDNGNESGTGSASVTGTDNGTGNESGTGSGSGSATTTGSGNESGSGSATGTDNGTGNESSTGSGSGSATTTGSGNESGSGSATGTGNESGSASATGTDNVSSPDGSDISQIEPTSSLCIITTTRNGVTTVYRTTCPIDTTVTEKTSLESQSSKLVDESSTIDLSIPIESTKDGMSSTEKFPNTGINNDEASSTNSTTATTATNNNSGHSVDITTTSDVSNETGTAHKQNGSSTEKQTVNFSSSSSSSSASSSSISEVVSLYEDNAVKLLGTPFIAAILALL